jgi:hypothetical protein
LVREWKEFRYSIYEKTEDTQSQKSLGMELLLDGNFGYFKKLKGLYTKKEWPEVLQNILTQFNNDRHGVYVKILIAEKLKPQLLEYCKQNSNRIVEYYEHLLPDNKNDVSSIFAKYIKQKAAHANGRGQYSDVCQLIRHYKKVSKKAADDIKIELTSEYAKRPAFLDELSRV